MGHLVLVGLVFSVLFITNVQGTYKLCAFPSMDSIACDRVEEGNSNVSCIRVTDSVVCSDMIKNGLADFALYNADEAVLAGKFVRDFVNVIGESRDKKRYTEQNFEDLVVVVRKPFSGSFADLRGLGYCHPGVGISHKISDKILKSFEQSVVPKGPSCNNLYSIAEQELRDLESFFGPSCRPGRWARDDDLENKLKKTYRNMCQLCDSPTQCSNSQLSSGLEREALDCLVGQDGRQGGDVAFVSLAAVDSYFGLSTKSASASFAEYLFLCPNQTVMPINTSTKPCIWASQPWDLLITRKAVSGELQDKLNVWLSDVKKEGSERWQHHLRKLLLKDSGVFISKSYNSSLPIHQYINRGVAERDNRHCKRSVEWCTTEEAEWEKCKWLQGATETFGIEPHMQCSTRAEDKWKCMQKIAEGTADLLSIPTDDGFLARTVFNLSTLFFEDNVINANYRIIAVVKNQNGVANGFKGLKNRKACFPEYKGLAWNGFVSTVKEQGLLGRQCPEYYFSETCAPGALSNEFNPSRRRTLPQLCSLCPANDAGFNCSPHFPRRNRTLRALQCLDNNGDVAFINLRAVLSGDRVPQLDPSIDPTKYKILCSNGSTVEFSLNVDDSCALSVGVHGEVMARNNRNYVQDTDAKELLLQLNRWFGTSEDDVRNTISLFGKYKGTSGLMFEERTISLVDSDDNNYDYISSYKALLDSVSKVCTGGATSLNSFGSLGLLLTTLTAMAFYM